ncbi:GNAT family N-acetyltransferase [Williamwhitmania taraxaci]|uniref:Ribosomal protein S18 acetylase RimI n=1 Tax=Williamwhitmania taraxaci TaxID=1640674 RepID=A0A1G6GW46_9BACT|nr:N-acetyltransferase [Williamwhitmania taraxaci]SDB85905.1 Ribosomal protein S18 acetylase RimI [Williamwhitmania taraxaci]
MGNIVVRPVEISELGLVYQLDRQAFGDNCYPPFVLRQLYDVHGDLFQVALINDSLVGYVIGAVETGGSSAWILALTTDDGCRNVGIATALLTEIVGHLHKQQISSIKLTVAEGNVAAIHLYCDKFSFTIARKVENYFGENTPRLLLQHKGI